MPNTTGFVNTICPFYQNERPNKIICEGFTDEQKEIMLLFNSPKEKKLWQKKYCMLFTYEICPIASPIFRGYDEKSR